MRSNTASDAGRVTSYWCWVSPYCSVMSCSLLAFTVSLFPVISSVSQKISGVLKLPATMTLGCLLVFRLNRSLRLSFIEKVEAFYGCSGWSVKGSQVDLLGLGELDGAPDTLVVLAQCSLLNGEDAIFDGTENGTSMFGSVLPVHLCVMTREEAISRGYEW